MHGKIIIIDYGMGNLRSVQKKFENIGVSAEVSSDLNSIANANKLVLPGVGHFSHGVKKIKELGIWSILNEKVIKKKTPVLGICLGMQLMAKSSTEGDAEGLGWLDSDVIHFDIKDRLKYKVPHIGWNSVIANKETRLLQGIPKKSMFYFVHAYHMKCRNQSDVLATTEYEYSFTSAIQKDNIFGTQFHPEKSHDVGEKLIKNFVELA